MVMKLAILKVDTDNQKNSEPRTRANKGMRLVTITTRLSTSSSLETSLACIDRRRLSSDSRNSKATMEKDSHGDANRAMRSTARNKLPYK